MGSADQIPVYKVLAVEDYVVPLDGADVLQQRAVNGDSVQVAGLHYSGDLLGLPVDDAGQNQRQPAPSSTTPGRIISDQGGPDPDTLGTKGRPVSGSGSIFTFYATRIFPGCTVAPRISEWSRKWRTMRTSARHRFTRTSAAKM